MPLANLRVMLNSKKESPSTEAAEFKPGVQRSVSPSDTPRSVSPSDTLRSVSPSIKELITATGVCFGFCTLHWFVSITASVVFYLLDRSPYPPCRPFRCRFRYASTGGSSSPTHFGSGDSSFLSTSFDSSS